MNVPGLELESMRDFLRRLPNIFLASMDPISLKTAAATSVLKISGRMLKDIIASFSCIVSFLKEESNKNCIR